MKTGHQIGAAVLALAALALGCDDGTTPVDGSPPVAVSDRASTELDTPVLLRPTTNDVADGVGLAAQTIDLDPTREGQQGRYVAAAGTFTLLPDGAVLFAPAAGFTGETIGSYVVADGAGRLSNPADLIVTVRARPPSVADPNTLPLDQMPVELPHLVPASLGM